MTHSILQPYPATYLGIDQATQENGFTMPSDVLTCSLLRTVAAAKPRGKFLELGTGTGLSTSWILDGMDAHSTLVSVDHDPALLAIARQFLGEDRRLSLVEMDGAAWVHANQGQQYDFIFADTWHGKYLLLDEVLDMLSVGGMYVVDDMLPQNNWPDGHQEKAINFVHYLENRSDLVVSKLHWATGIMIAVRVK